MVNFGGFRRENSAKLEVYHVYISCLKYHFWQLLSRSKHSMIKSELSVSDLLNHWIFSNLENFATRGGRTMHPERFIKNINRNFYFDHEAVQWNLTELFSWIFQKLSHNSRKNCHFWWILLIFYTIHPQYNQNRRNRFVWFPIKLNAIVLKIFFFVLEPNKIRFGSRTKWKLSAHSYAVF